MQLREIMPLYFLFSICSSLRRIFLRHMKPQDGAKHYALDSMADLKRPLRRKGKYITNRSTRSIAIRGGGRDGERGQASRLGAKRLAVRRIMITFRSGMNTIASLLTNVPSSMTTLVQNIAQIR